MQLLAVCVLMAAAAVTDRVAASDLSCDCRVQRHYHWTFALHCQQNEASGVSCRKADVPEIPQGYVYIPGYTLIKLYRIFLSWSAAKQFCEEEGSQLAIPRESYAYSGLKQIFRAEKQEKRVSWAYLGITDQAKDGVFAGVDGLPVSFLPWRQNEPSNTGGNEHCIGVNDLGLLNAGPCEEPAPFFCERRLSVTVPANYVWLQKAGRFFKVHKEKQPHAEASNLCHSENATLAVPDTWDRVHALQSLLELNDESYLVDFTDEAVEGDFVTETGRHLNDMEFQVWKVGEPNNIDYRGQSENCLVLSSRGYYTDVACDKALPFICEIAP